MKAVAHYIDGSKRVIHGPDAHAWAQEQSWNHQVRYSVVTERDIGSDPIKIYTYYRDGEEVDAVILGLEE